MTRNTLLRTIAGSLLLCCLTAVAQGNGNWRAASTTARSITGDIVLSDEKISINFASFTMSRVRSLDSSELSTVFDSDSSAGGSGSLYRLNIPASRKFLHRNSLCGSENTEWMVTYVTGRSLQIAFFSGQKPPLFTLDAISNSTDLCGTYSYVK
jgi:hypothetical protein